MATTMEPTQTLIEYGICYGCDTVQDVEDMIQCGGCQHHTCLNCDCSYDGIVFDEVRE